MKNGRMGKTDGSDKHSSRGSPSSKLRKWGTRRGPYRYMYVCMCIYIYILYIYIYIYNHYSYYCRDRSSLRHLGRSSRKGKRPRKKAVPSGPITITITITIAITITIIILSLLLLTYYYLLLIYSYSW